MRWSCCACSIFDFVVASGLFKTFLFTIPVQNPCIGDLYICIVNEKIPLFYYYDVEQREN